MKGAVAFRSTPEDEIVICGVRGMGIKRGVSVITGGGYSGKSTVLDALSAGIYNHVKGDGRELCVTDGSAVTITAEDGRAVSRLNISPFIKWIPGGDSREFSTGCASGSTSQAANIMEAVECGARLLLIDEDRSATNFMIRDAVMRRLIKNEPITPFTERAGELAGRGISTILVIGGSCEYLSAADKIYMMEEFAVSDVTVRAKRLAGEARGARTDGEVRDHECAPDRKDETAARDLWRTGRVLGGAGFSSYPAGSGSERLEVSDTGFIIIGDERIDIRALHDIASPAQIDAIAFMLRCLMRGADSKDEFAALALAKRGLAAPARARDIDIDQKIGELYESVRREGLDAVDTGFFTEMNRFLELPRPAELRAAINRMRFIEMKPGAHAARG